MGDIRKKIATNKYKLSVGAPNGGKYTSEFALHESTNLRSEKVKFFEETATNGDAASAELASGQREKYEKD